MKQYISLLLLLLACCPSAALADKETTYLPSIEVKSREVVQSNREVSLTMQLDLSRLKMRTQHTLALTPVLVSKDGSRKLEFPPVVIDGKTRNRVYLRAQALKSVELPPYHTGEAQVIIRRQNGKAQTYDYCATAPYERWMLDSRLELHERVHGCVNCPEGTAFEGLPGTLLPEFVPDYRTARIAPKPEPHKVRAETRTARLQFRQDSYRILPEFKNNRAELDTVSSSIELVKKNADVKITGIYITGYASPEGSVPHNLKLSENRAKALTDYIRRNENIARDMLHVDWKGEDWVGFREVLAGFPGLLKRDEVYRIIDECKGDRDACEKQLRDLVPATIYTRLLNEVYPLLRRNEYRIEYNVRNFNLEEARRMINERPDLLSLTEMYKVAGSYEKGSAQYEKAMQTAARLYPNEPSVLNDRANDAIARRRFAEAVKILESSPATQQDARLLNTLGVAYSGAGDARKAEELFTRAEKAGSTEAAHNLVQVKKVIEQL